MKKQVLLSIVVILTFAGVLNGQSFDWNIRGGLNMMNGQPTGKSISLQYHVGVQAGVRITNYGIYGEALYSIHENQDGYDPVSYFMPGIVGKRYWQKFLFVEFGGAFLIMTGEPEIDDPTFNPENKPVFLAGLGTKVSIFEFSLRAISRSEYGIMQVTAAFKF